MSSDLKNEWTHGESTHSRDHGMRRALTIWGLLSQNPSTWSNHEKNIGEIQTTGHSAKHLPRTSQPVKIMKSKKRPRNPYRPEEAKET